MRIVASTALSSHVVRCRFRAPGNPSERGTVEATILMISPLCSLGGLAMPAAGRSPRAPRQV